MSKRDKPHINIRFDSQDPVSKILSNLAETPFSLYDGIERRWFKTFESYLQGMKFKEQYFRNIIALMDGKEALRIGRQVTQTIQDISDHSVYLGEMQAPYGQEVHKQWLLAGLVAKFRQNEEAARALLATKEYFIYHDVGEESPFTSLKEVVFIDMLLEIRDRILS